jgi:hypothetical protein
MGFAAGWPTPDGASRAGNMFGAAYCDDITAPVGSVNGAHRMAGSGGDATTGAWSGVVAVIRAECGNDAFRTASGVGGSRPVPMTGDVMTSATSTDDVTPIRQGGNDASTRAPMGSTLGRIGADSTLGTIGAESTLGRIGAESATHGITSDDVIAGGQGSTHAAACTVAGGESTSSNCWSEALTERARDDGGLAAASVGGACSTCGTMTVSKCSNVLWERSTLGTACHVSCIGMSGGVGSRIASYKGLALDFRSATQGLRKKQSDKQV